MIRENPRDLQLLLPLEEHQRLSDHQSPSHAHTPHCLSSCVQSDGGSTAGCLRGNRLVSQPDQNQNHNQGFGSNLVLMLMSVSSELQTVGPSALPASTAGLDPTTLTSVTSVTSTPEPREESTDQVAPVSQLDDKHHHPHLQQAVTGV